MSAAPRFLGPALIVVLATVVTGAPGAPGTALVNASLIAKVANAPVIAWTALEAPLPANAGAAPLASLSHVACPASGSCVAVGTYRDTSANQQGLIETLSGGSWTATEAPLPTPAGADPLVSFGGVACAVDGSCIATGTYKDSSANQQGLIESLSAGTWTATESPLPGNAGSNPVFSLGAPACPADGSCVATGNYDDTAGKVRSAVITLAAGIWTATEVSLPANADTSAGSSIGSPACPADGSCVAMAKYTDTSANVQSAIETLSAGVWTPMEAPLPPDEPAPGHERNLLSSVVCPSVGSCVAVGSFSPTNGSFQGLIETLAAGTWTATEAQLPADAPTTDAFAQLDAVTCPETGACVAVGWYYDTAGTYHVVYETESAGVWTPMQQPLPTRPPARNPANPDTGIGAATCPAAGSCVAVGSYVTKSQKDKSIIGTLAGGSWSTIKAPLPTKADGNLASDLNDVTCTADGSCLAAGSAGGDPLIETIPGGESAPAVSSTDQAAFTVDQDGTFAVTATGSPLPSIKKKGKLPKGLHFSAGTGSATIFGTPVGAPGTFHVIIEAQNGVLPTATQFLTITISN
jgi:hypothetical protein